MVKNFQPNFKGATTYVINVSTDTTHNRILKIADLMGAIKYTSNSKDGRPRRGIGHHIIFMKKSL